MVLDYPVSLAGAAACAQDVLGFIEKQHGRQTPDQAYFACLNPHSYAVARKDSRFMEALKGARWLVPDGVGVVLASVLLGGRIRARVTGYDFFVSLSELLNRRSGSRVFFLGSSEATLEKLVDKMSLDFPGIEIVGTYSPPFKTEFSQEDVDAMISRIRLAAPEVLWVSLTAPKQELWIKENLSRARVPFAGAIGAVFDFYVGNIKRSHKGFQRLGLEWLPRLVQEPRRLWRRTFISAPVFVTAVVWSALKKWSGAK